MAESNVVDQGGARPVSVWITPALDADYERRGVYPHLRIKHATSKKSGSQGRFDLPRAEAEEIFKDALKQSYVSRGVAGRGTTTAYSSLVSRLRREVGMQMRDVQPASTQISFTPIAAIQREERLSRVMIEATKASPARLSPGCKVVLDEDTSDEAEVLEDFDAYRVGDDPHLRLGYVVMRYSNGGRYFYPAGRLSTAGGEQTHLRLAWDATNQRRAS